jgi:YbbR domain-containing protein
LNIKLFPEKVKVTFKVGLSRFQEIRPEDFKLSVAFSDIRENKQLLKITTESIPDYLYDLKITPDEIEYLIQN